MIKRLSSYFFFFFVAMFGWKMWELFITILALTIYRQKCHYYIKVVSTKKSLIVKPKITYIGATCVTVYVGYDGLNHSSISSKSPLKWLEFTIGAVEKCKYGNGITRPYTRLKIPKRKRCLNDHTMWLW